MQDCSKELDQPGKEEHDSGLLGNITIRCQADMEDRDTNMQGSNEQQGQPDVVPIVVDDLDVFSSWVLSKKP